MKKNYTIILDWNGGTYVSQHSATCQYSAIKKWVDEFFFLEIGVGVGKVSKKELLNQVKDMELGLLEGLKSVWCESLFIDEKLGIIHIVKTEM